MRNRRNDYRRYDDYDEREYRRQQQADAMSEFMRQALFGLILIPIGLLAVFYIPLYLFP
jgi:hypothetical protein